MPTNNEKANNCWHFNIYEQDKLIRLSPVLAQLCINKSFIQAEIRAIAELRVRLVEAFQ